MNTKTVLKESSAATYDTNGARGISAYEVRAFNEILIDATYTPAGVVRIWPGLKSTIPAGWILCDGSQKSQIVYPDLFAALGGNLSPWGVQDTTFSLPLLKPSETIIQANQANENLQNNDESFYKLALHGGENKHTLLLTEIPKHTHTINHENTSGNTGSGIAGGATTVAYQNTTSGSGGDTAGQTTPHQNMPPFVAMYYIIKLF